MKLFLVFLSTVYLMSVNFARAEEATTFTKKYVSNGSPEMQEYCGIPAIEKGLTTDIQRFKAVYKKYDERDSLGDDKKVCKIELALRALELGKLLFPANSKNLANLAYNYAIAYREDGRRMDAEAITYAVGRFEAAFEKDSPEIIPVYEDACIASIENKENPKEPYCTKAIQLSKKVNGEDSLEYADTIVDVSPMMLADSKYYWDDTKDVLMVAKSILENKSADKDLRMAGINFSLGKLQASLGRNKKAIEYLEQALLILDQPQYKTSGLTLTAHAFMVESLEKLGQKDEATKHCLIISQIAPTFENKNMQPLFTLVPEYPKGAANMGIDGSVSLEFGVDELGYVVNPKITSSTVNNKILEKASVDTVKKYRYAPRIVDGKPVSTEGVKKVFTYKIEMR